jgi:glycosyltransferase involved in cell wall biosynthesis
MGSMSRYAFVIPRCGIDIAGGAETLVRELAEKLAMRGDSIDILTTCAKDNRTWDNAFPAGETIERGVRVMRFPVSPRSTDVWVPLQIRLSEGLRLSAEEELDWMEHSVYSTELFEYIERHEQTYRAFFFAPYLFGTTFWGSLIHPHKSILIPCLHDESYAYTKVVASMFRHIRGCLFNAVPEQWLAESLFGEVRGAEVGMGFEPLSDTSYETTAIPQLAGVSKYLLYVGRKETGKNLHKLVDYFVAAKEAQAIEKDLALVILGGGSFDDVHRPKAKLRSDIIDLPHLTEVEKQAVIARSLCLVQPSTNESFSIVIMEAWRLSVPVLVSATGAVTRYHVEKSGGGLFYANEVEFAAVVNELMHNASLRQDFAAAGKRYVEQAYSWDAVLAKFDRAVTSILTDDAQQQRVYE